MMIDALLLHIAHIFVFFFKWNAFHAYAIWWGMRDFFSFRKLWREEKTFSVEEKIGFISAIYYNAVHAVCTLEVVGANLHHSPRFMHLILRLTKSSYSSNFNLSSVSVHSLVLRWQQQMRKLHFINLRRNRNLFLF